jgi:chromosome segregation ATPase
MVSISTALVMMGCGLPLGSVVTSPRQLATETDQVLDAIRKEEENIFKVLDDNIKKVQKIAQLEGNAGNDPAKSLNESVTQLEEVTKVFEDKAAHKEEVRKEILQKVSKLQDLRSRAQDEMAKLEQKKRDYNHEIATIELGSDDNKAVKKEAFQQAVSYVDKQIDIWNKFMKTYSDVETRINDVNKRVDRFLAIIEASAIIYREALNLITLQRDVQEAFSLLNEDMPEMQRLSEEMVKSWEYLDYQVEVLLSISEPLPPAPAPTGS